MTREELMKRYAGGAGTQVMLSKEARDAITKNVGAAGATSQGRGGAQIFRMREGAETVSGGAYSPEIAYEKAGRYAGGADARDTRIERSWAEVDNIPSEVSPDGGSDYDPGSVPELAPMLAKAEKNAMISKLFYTGTPEEDEAYGKKAAAFARADLLSAQRGIDARTNAGIERMRTDASAPVVTSPKLRKELDAVDTQQALAEWKTRGWVKGMFPLFAEPFRKKTPDDAFLALQADAAAAGQRSTTKAERLRRTRFDFGRPSAEEDARVNATRWQTK